MNSDLPNPDSPEFEALGLASSVREIYRLLYENQSTPLTQLEIRSMLEERLGMQEQLDRRRRDLNPYFEVERSRSGKETRYRLVARKAVLPAKAGGISERVRAQVFQFGRCDMCGRTVAEHRVVLQVDHKMPQNWGGTDDLENLQALCEPCNRGKKAHFATLDEFGEEIRKASEFPEPQKRIGELLKAVYPDEIRSDVIEMVACQQQYQEDWQRRLRDLRFLGWDYRIRRVKDERGRMRAFYRLTTWTKWPDDIKAAIKLEESARRGAR